VHAKPQARRPNARAEMTHLPLVRGRRRLPRTPLREAPVACQSVQHPRQSRGRPPPPAGTRQSATCAARQGWRPWRTWLSSCRRCIAAERAHQRDARYQSDERPGDQRGTPVWQRAADGAPASGCVRVARDRATGSAGDSQSSWAGSIVNQHESNHKTSTAAHVTRQPWAATDRRGRGRRPARPAGRPRHDKNQR
jgi:hypothetical protein